jgi:cytochrome P450
MRTDVPDAYDLKAHAEMVETVRRAVAGHPAPQVIRSLAAAYVRLYRLRDASIINRGMCVDFARDVIALLPGATAVSVIDDNHTLILHAGVVYDAETPDGVPAARWWDVPAVRLMIDSWL